MFVPLDEPKTVATVSPARLGVLGGAMIVLGVARGWPDGLRFVHYVSAFGQRLIDSPKSVPWPAFSGIAWAFWPVLLGIFLLSKRSPKYLAAATLTCVALGLERAIALGVGGLFDSGWSTLYQGGYDRSLGSAMPRGSALAWSIVSAISWLSVAFLAYRTAPRRPRSPESHLEKKARRRASARLSNAVSALFATSVFALAAWTTYITVLERLPWVRSLVISGDSRKSRQRRHYVETAEDRKVRDAERLFNEAQGMSLNQKYLEARRSYIKAANRFEDLMEEYPKERYYRQRFALASNNLAWFLATCAEETVREPESAVLVAKKAIAANPNDGNSLNTLAVAQFRNGEDDAALASFAKSMKLRDGGDSFDWYFLAQIEAKRNHPKQARDWYDKAVSWGASYRPDDPELSRFQAEAAEKLGLPKPVKKVPTDPTKPETLRPVYLGPAGEMRRRR